MPSKYSAGLVRSVCNVPQRTLGQDLAMLCIAANLPAVYVSQVLGVSRMTLHTWFRGGEVRERKHSKIHAFMRVVRGDFDAGRLPVKTVREARSYLQTMSSEPLKNAVEQAKG